jgi:hypothetical protein
MSSHQPPRKASPSAAREAPPSAFGGRDDPSPERRVRDPPAREEPNAFVSLLGTRGTLYEREVIGELNRQPVRGEPPREPPDPRFEPPTGSAYLLSRRSGKRTF